MEELKTPNGHFEIPRLKNRQTHANGIKICPLSGNQQKLASVLYEMLAYIRFSFFLFLAEEA